MSKNTDLTYYQNNWDVVLSKAKDYYKNNKERLRNEQEINTGTYLKKKKIKKENMGKIATAICLKKKNKDIKKNQKNYHEAKKSQYNNK